MNKPFARRLAGFLLIGIIVVGAVRLQGKTAAAGAGWLGEREPQSLVQQVGRRLMAQPAVQAAGVSFQLQLLPDRNFANAFILPGGQIYLTQGLLLRLASEGQLAGVLGHEIGHVLTGPGHPAGVVFAFPAGSLTNPGGAEEAANSNLSPEQLQKLAQGRQDELHADVAAVCLLRGAGYDPHALLEVMDVFEQAAPSNQRTSEAASDHPYPESRKAVILNTIAHPEVCP